MSRNGDWIQTFTGKQFYPLDPRPDELDIIDIAHALSLKCRYAGHCRDFYSVAQHSVLVSENVPPQDALWGLLHDAAEAYLSDIPRPIKASLIGFNEMEERVMRSVAERYGLPWPEPPWVGRADLTLLHTERRDLMATPPIPWGTDALAAPLPGRIEPWPWHRAKIAFLGRFDKLTGRKDGAA